MVNKKFLSFILKCLVSDGVLAIMEINDISIFSVVKFIGKNTHFRVEV